MRGLPALLFVVLLAGCAAPAPDPDAPPAEAPILHLGGCEQTHAFIPFPAQAFADSVPEGWRVQTSDPAGTTTQFYLATSACANATLAGRDLGPFGEAWGYLFVEPPNGTDGETLGDLWPLGAVVTAPEAVALYEAWGFTGLVAQGEVGITPGPAAGPLVGSRSLAVGGGETFDLRAGVPSQPDEFHDGAFRVWIPDPATPERVRGSIRYQWDAGEQVGFGEGVLRYDGPLLNAPPAMDALVHHVRNVPVRVAASA